MMKILFEEKQKFNIILSGVVLLPLAVVFGIPVYVLISEPEASFREIALSNGLINLLPLILICLAIVIICSAELKTTITEKEILVSFFPFLPDKKVIPWEEVKEVFVREYSPISEYGGWGIPFVQLAVSKGLANNRALNTRGNKGLQLVLENGKRLLIGTQVPDKLELVLRENQINR